MALAGSGEVNIAASVMDKLKTVFSILLRFINAFPPGFIFGGRKQYRIYLRK